MFTASQSGVRRTITEAFESMKTGALLMIVGSILVGVGLTILLVLFISIPLTASVVYERQLVIEARGASIGLVAVFAVSAVTLIVGSTICLVGILAKFVPGTNKLVSVDPGYGAPSTLVKLGYTTGLVLTIVGIPLMLIRPIGILVGFLLIVLAFILLIVAHIGLVILCFKLNDAEKIALYLVAGILFIVGIFITLVDFIGWTLLYTALGESIKRHSTQTATPVQASTHA